MSAYPDTERNIDPEDAMDRLKICLQQRLPGEQSHRRFAAGLCYGRHRGPALPSTRSAAVMVLLTRGEQGWEVPMTVRPGDMVEHAGQVCFPGGAVEPGESIEAAALRELTEELGLVVPTQHVLGRLTPLWVFASDFWVTPVLAYHADPLEYRANPREVAEVLEMPLACLMDQGAVRKCVVSTRPGALTVPAIELAGQVIWGASSMILGELSELWRASGLACR